MKHISNILGSIAVAVLVSACGGGSSSTEVAAAASENDGSCQLVNGIYQVTQAGCKTPDNAVCTGTTVSVSSGNVNLSSGNILNLNGTKYKCTGA